MYWQIALLLVCLILGTGPARADSLCDRVLKNGKLRAAYVEWYPLLIRDPNTKKISGIGYEVLELAAKRLGLKLEITEAVTWGTMIEGLKTNRYDIIACPVWANSTRARAADFSRSICYSQICAFTKYGDKRIDSSLKQLNGDKYKIACVDGEMAEMIAKADFPTVKRLALPQMAPISDILLSVSTGKADITFTEPLFAYDFLKHNAKSVQNITENKPLRVFPNVYMFKMGEPDFKAMLNTTIDEIANSGDLDRIISKYEPYPKAYLRCAKPYQQ